MITIFLVCFVASVVFCKLGFMVAAHERQSNYRR
jgi:hypothetical protein